MTLQEYFRAAAEKHRWTFARLARETGIPEGNIANWFSRDPPRGEPDIGEAVKLAEAMKLGMDEVFRGIVPGDQIEEIISEAVWQVRDVIRREVAEAKTGDKVALPAEGGARAAVVAATPTDPPSGAGTRRGKRRGGKKVS